MYSHVNTDGGVVDCEWYSILNILLDLCKAVGKHKHRNDRLCNCVFRVVISTYVYKVVSVVQIVLIVWRQIHHL